MAGAMGRRVGGVLGVCGLLLGALACSGTQGPNPSHTELGDAANAGAREAAGVLQTGECPPPDRPLTEPDLFGWDPGSRAKIASIAATDGPPVVRLVQNGCDVSLTLLPQCAATAAKSEKLKYQHTAMGAEKQIRATSKRELYARFPVGVTDLGGALGTGKGLRAHYKMEGVDRLPGATAFELHGQCEGATHVVGAIYRGEFVIAAGDKAFVEASTTLVGVKGETGVESVDKADPGTPIRIELWPIPVAAPAAPPAPVATQPAPAPQPNPAPQPAMAAKPPPAPPKPQATTPAPSLASACPPGMASLPGGSFRMGSDSGEADEKPVHIQELSPFCLDLTEVTVGAYAACSGCEPPEPLSDDCIVAGQGKDNHPRNCVTWTAADRFCRSLGKRLPTEAEWEFAARGGSEGRTWPWGNSKPTEKDACWNRSGTCAVKSFRAGAFGLFDMAGGVWEWTGDWYGDYPTAQHKNYAGPSTGSLRVVRGGSWFDPDPSGLRGALRVGLAPSNAHDFLGFRCARTP